MAFDCSGMVGCGASDAWCDIAAVADNAFPAVGRLVFCTLLSALSSLATVPLLVWFLPASLAAASGLAARSQVESSTGDRADVRRFFMVGQALVGARCVAGNLGHPVALYVTLAGS